MSSGGVEERTALPADAGAFLREVAEPCRPVVLRGACGAWPLVTAFCRSHSQGMDYLRGFDPGAAAEAFVGERAIAGRYHYSDDLESFNFTREPMALAAGLDRIEAAAHDDAGPTIYLGSLPERTHFPGLARDNAVPFLPRGIEPRVWIGNASRVSCHYDTFDNLACAVAGTRRFTLYAPELVGDLYVGPIDHTMAGQPVSLAASAAPGDPRYPRFDAIRDRALTVELEPGDALYLPKLWWHQVEAPGTLNVMANFWWDAFGQGGDAPFATMLLAMIALAERPDGERAAWRAFFDHYVFRPERHPLEHLPEPKRGILGRIAGGNHARIRAIAMQMLRGG